MSQGPNLVLEWLSKLHLAQYVEAFIDNGYDDLEVCKQIGEPDLDAIGVHIEYHRHRLLAAVQKLIDEDKRKALSYYFTLEPLDPSTGKREDDLRTLGSHLRAAGVHQASCPGNHNPRLTDCNDFVTYPKLKLKVLIRDKLAKDGINLGEAPYTYKVDNNNHFLLSRTVSTLVLEAVSVDLTRSRCWVCGDECDKFLWWCWRPLIFLYGFGDALVSSVRICWQSVCSEHFVMIGPSWSEYWLFLVSRCLIRFWWQMFHWVNDYMWFLLIYVVFLSSCFCLYLSLSFFLAVFFFFFLSGCIKKSHQTRPAILLWIHSTWMPEMDWNVQTDLISAHYGTNWFNSKESVILKILPLSFSVLNSVLVRYFGQSFWDNQARLCPTTTSLMLMVMLNPLCSSLCKAAQAAGWLKSAGDAAGELALRLQPSDVFGVWPDFTFDASCFCVTNIAASVDFNVCELLQGSRLFSVFAQLLNFDTNRFNLN